MTEFRAMQSASDRFADYSERTSTATRALVLSIIAVSWLFLGDAARPTGSDEPAQSATALAAANATPLLAVAIGLSVAALVLDLAQYAFGSFAYYRLARTTEIVLARGSAQLPQDRIDKAWDRAAANGFLSVILTAVGISDAELSSNRSKAVARGRDVVAALHKYQAAPKLYVADPGPTHLSEADLQSLAQALNNPWSPRLVVEVTLWLFGLKLGAAMLAGVILCVFAGQAVLC